MVMHAVVFEKSGETGKVEGKRRSGLPKKYWEKWIIMGGGGGGERDEVKTWYGMMHLAF